MICAHELWEGAQDGPRAATLLLQLARAMVVRLYVYRGPTRLMGPRSSLELLVQRAQARAEGLRPSE